MSPDYFQSVALSDEQKQFVNQQNLDTKKKKKKSPIAFCQSEANLFVGHELNCSLWSDFDDVDAVSSPQWPHTSLSDHLGKASGDLHAVALGGVNLTRTAGQHVLTQTSPDNAAFEPSHLHEDFESVQWGRAGARHRSSSSSSH